MLFDVPRERSQRFEDFVIIGIAGDDGDLISRRQHEAQFERVDRIETEAFPEDRRIGIDALRIDIEVQPLGDVFGEFAFELVHDVRALRRKVVTCAAGLSLVHVTHRGGK